MQYKSINAFDAKTHLSRLLRDAEAGQTYVILRRGKPVARLAPTESREKSFDFKGIAASFRKFRRGLRGRFKARDWVEEGRRH